MAPPGVYVYGIVQAERTVPPGIGGLGIPPLPLRVITEGPVGAVVSAAPSRLRARRRDPLTHQRLLLRLAETGPVLPMRFGTVAPDEAAVRERLALTGNRRLAALERLAGRVEVNVRALAAPDALAGLVREDRTIQRLREAAHRRPGREANMRLGEAVLAALSRRAVEAGRHAVLELTPLAHAVAAGPRVSGCLLSMSFLVDRTAVDRFRTAAADFATLRHEHVVLRVAGPLPCYSFVREAPLAGAGAPAGPDPGAGGEAEV
ncbi:GvpL/GvpF family gas vesicle protein [Streptomyces sp. NPDC088116]|uniref:GvpL/GvpF family gas vesicle protein n=1 Tax=Streptomyces sp. NPDC088116 TaxID=3365825 RepID=UPI00380A125B